MGTYLGNPDGTVTDRQIKAYAEAAEGGAGLIFMDNVVPVHMTSCGLTAHADEYVAGLSLLAEAVREHGAVPGMQIAHPGRDAAFVGSEDVIGASPITFEPWYQMGARLPRSLSIDEIHELVAAFGRAAARCKDAGCSFSGKEHRYSSDALINITFSFSSAHSESTHYYLKPQTSRIQVNVWWKMPLFTM